MFRIYDHSVRPVYNATNNVVVKFGLTLIQIMDMVSACGGRLMGISSSNIASRDV